MIKIDGDYIIFTSGRSMYANFGIVGIGPDGNISEGFDSAISWPPDEGFEKSDLTSDDMRELADMIIERWIAFKESLKPCG